MSKQKRFELTIILVAAILVGFGVWGLFYGGFTSGEQTNSQPTIGAVSEMKSEGEIKRHFNGSFAWKGLASQADIYERDTVYVGTGSSLTVKMVDNTIVTVGEDSLVVFERAKMLKGGQSSVYLVKGQMAVEGQNVTVDVARGKKIVAEHQAKFTVVKREKKVSVSVETAQTDGVAYFDKNSVVQKLSAKPKENVALASVEKADEEMATETPVPEVVKPEQAKVAPPAPVVPDAVAPASVPAVAETPAPAVEPPKPVDVVDNSPEITPLAPESEKVIDLTREFPSMNFKFHVKDPARKNLVFQISKDADFSQVSFQSVISPTEMLKNSDAKKGSDYETKFSGVYLVLSEPVADLAYSNAHRLFWRVSSGTGEGSVSSEPQAVNFQVNPGVQVVSHVGASTHKSRQPSSLSSQAIIWDVKDRLPTRYRMSFYSDSKYQNKLCSEVIRAGGVPSNLSGTTNRVEGAELSSREEFVPKAGSFCHAPLSQPTRLRTAYYRIEPLSGSGTPLPLAKDSEVRGTFSFNK